MPLLCVWKVSVRGGFLEQVTYLYRGSEKLLEVSQVEEIGMCVLGRATCSERESRPIWELEILQNS